MGSTRCRHFVQNAWKKDLCSNCFKSKDEHAAAAPARARHRQAVLPAPAGPPPQGILKGGSRTRVGKAHRVYFPAEESEVIGEGGEDAGPPSDDDSDDQADGDWGPTPVEDDPQEREEERLLQALTRSNTDFNSVAANLEGAAPPAPSTAAVKGSKQRSTAPLQLGRTQTDSTGRKQTLLVTVQPFGKPPGKSATPSAAASTGDHVTKIPVATPPSAASTNGDVVLKSIVHTGDELPPIKSPAKSPLKSATSTVPSPSEPSPSTGPAAAPSPTLLKLNDAQETSGTTVKSASPAPLSSKHMFLKSIVEPAADAVSNGSDPVTHAPPAAAAPVAPVSPSPVSLSAVTTKAGGVSPPRTATSLSKPAASTVKAVASSVKPAVSPSVTTVTSASAAPTVTSVTTSSTRREGKRTHITRGTPISKNNELMLKTKLIPLRTATILNNNNNNKRNSYGQREEETSMVKINGSRSEPVMLIESKQLDSSDEDERTYSNVQVQNPSSKRLNGEESPGAQTKRLAGLLAPLGVGGAGVGSRELAGEPDGRADPDSSSESGSEPPALPQSPPPAVDPRPSFLHGLTARLTPSPSSPCSSPCLPLADKPRVPFKSSTVVQAAVQQQQQQQQQKAAAAAEPPLAPSCSPPSTAESSPSSSPSASPHGTPLAGLDSCSRQQKRQAPQPPQEQLYATPPPSKEATTTPMRPALGRSASTGSSTSSPSPTPSPSASPPSPQLSYHRKTSTTSVKDSKRRSSQHLFSMAPLPPLAPSRSESVPSGLGQVALGHSVTLGAHSGHSIAQALAQANSFVSMSPSPSTPGQPQPSPRRALSLSTDSLSGGGGSPTKHVISYDTERKKPGTKVRFSLRKFLGLSKEGMRSEVAAPEGLMATGLAEPLAPPQPRPRPRLEIIHPSDLSGRAVEVLRASGVEVRRQMLEQAAQQAQQAQQVSSRRNSDSTALGDVLASPVHQHQGAPGLYSSTPDSNGDVVKARPSKPPPPPRSQSLENDLAHSAHPGSHGSPSRPSRPPPPKAAHVDLLMRRHSATTTTPAPTPAPGPGHSVYANIACAASEVRTAPLKPQRTGSVRDSTAEGPRRTPLEATAGPGTGPTAERSESAARDQQPIKMTARSCSLSSQPEDSGYESVELSDSTQPQSMTDSENVYECVNGAPERSSSPECDSKRAAADGVRGGGANGGTLGGGDRPSSVSAQYCGSETESDIYSPYSFYGSEEGDDGEADSSWKWRSRARKGRSVVHKSMEENYGAVVSANLEALAQLLEQIRTGPAVPPALRPLKTMPASDLSWADFTVDAPQVGVVVGRWVFLAAQWGCHAVTLGVLPNAPGHQTGTARRGRGAGPLPFALMPIVEFSDQVPTACMASLPGAQRPAGGHVPALVGVLARVRVDTLASYGSWLRGVPLRDADGEAAWRDAGMSLLQLLNALLVLQNLREVADPDSVVLLRAEASASAQTLDGTPQLSLLHGVTPAPAAASTDASVSRSLSQCALAGTRALLPDAPPAPLLTSLLSEAESSSSDALARAKAVLEYWLWGPAEAAPSMAALQRWLDLERATVLHRLVCARAAAGPSHRLAIQQQSHLLFLVHTSAGAMADASRLLDTAGVAPLESAS